MSQTCGNCKHFYCEGDGRCCVKDETWRYSDDDACEKFENLDKYAGTHFRQITASPDVMAEKLVYDWGHLFHNGDIKIYWKSTILPDAVFSSKAEAIAATVAKLKEVCDE